jgi:hypothetical protein
MGPEVPDLLYLVENFTRLWRFDHRLSLLSRQRGGDILPQLRQPKRRAISKKTQSFEPVTRSGFFEESERVFGADRLLLDASPPSRE